MFVAKCFVIIQHHSHPIAEDRPCSGKIDRHSRLQRLALRAGKISSFLPDIIKAVCKCLASLHVIAGFLSGSKRTLRLSSVVLSRASYHGIKSSRSGFIASLQEAYNPHRSDPQFSVIH